VYRPTTLDERRAVALRMIDALPCLAGITLLVDDLDDRFLSAMAAWPVRLYGARNGALELIGQPHNANFELQPFREWLRKTAK
jgi:hypothetical protein